MAHYLVLNNLSDEAKPVALERGLCPPELAGEALLSIMSGDLVVIPAEVVCKQQQANLCWQCVQR